MVGNDKKQPKLSSLINTHIVLRGSLVKDVVLLVPLVFALTLALLRLMKKVVLSALCIAALSTAHQERTTIFLTDGELSMRKTFLPSENK